MRTLAIDCATENCSAALFDDTALIAGECRLLGRGHAEHLVPMIATLPDHGKADRIAVSLGPGSFTGVRIGLAAARALALAWNAQVVGYPTLSLIAAMARAQAGERPITVAMTGGHGEWFMQDFHPDGTAQTALASRRPADAAAAALHPLVAGNQADALIAQRGSGTPLSILPDARQFALLGETMLSADIAPLYGRAPDAKLPGVKP